MARYADLRRVTIAFVVATSADQFTLVALLWYVLEISGSPFALSAVILVNRLPAALSSPAAGRLLDLLPPARLMAAHSLARAILLAVIPAFNAAGQQSLATILMPAFCLGVLGPLTDVGVRVIVPRIVPPHELTAANGVLALGEQLPFIIGPAIGGALVGVLGVNALLVPAAGSLVIALILRRVDDRHDAATRAQRQVTTASGGYRLLWRHPAIRALLLLTFAYFFAFGPLEPALPIYVRDDLYAGARGYGALWAILGVGSVVGLLFVKPLARLRPGIVNAAGAIGWGLLLVPLLWVHSIGLALFLMFFAGVVWAPYIAIEASVIQQLTPASAHGVVFGARRSLIILASPSGAAVGGLLLGSLPAATVIFLSGLACIAAGVACACAKSVRVILPP
jgi:MFS family permease